MMVGSEMRLNGGGRQRDDPMKHAIDFVGVIGP